jgi:hypothetical protein
VLFQDIARRLHRRYSSTRGVSHWQTGHETVTVMWIPPHRQDDEPTAERRHPLENPPVWGRSGRSAVLGSGPRVQAVRGMLGNRGRARAGDRRRGTAVLDGLLERTRGVVRDHDQTVSPVQASHQHKRGFEGILSQRREPRRGGPCKPSASPLVTKSPAGVGFQTKSRRQAYRN